jgi:mRNA interferase RelE/StbE
LFFVKVDKKAGKSYRKMPEFYRKRIVELGTVLKDKPVPAQEYDVTKMEGMEDTYRIRVGEIRAVYTVNWNAKQIEIIEIGWRGKSYK